MRRRLRMKKVVAIVIGVCMIATNISPIGAKAATKKFDVQLVGQSSDFLSGYYVTYKINGVTYRSDEAAQRINQIAFDHMEEADRKKVLNVFAYQPNKRWDQFGKDYSQEMVDWYNDVTGGRRDKTFCRY